MQDDVQRPWWRAPAGLVLCGFLAIAGFFLITEHTAHLFGVLPYLLFAACPIMHLFMHHHHGGHGRKEDGQDEPHRHSPR